MGKRFTTQQLEELSQRIIASSPTPEDAEKQINFLKEWDDPVLWGENHFFDPDTGEKPLKVKDSFKPFLRDPSQNRAVRVGRQCIVEGTVIHTRDGKLCRIEDHPDAWLTDVSATTYELKAWGGYALRATGTHPVRTDKGWRTINQLTVGDKVEVLTKWNCWGNDIIPFRYHTKSGLWTTTCKEGLYQVTEKHAELLGWITADGSGLKYGICGNQTIKFTNTNPVYLDRVEELVTELFPDVVSKRYRKGKGYDITFGIVTKTAGNSFRHFMRCMEFDDGFPTAVSNYFSKNSVEAFFRGMYPADGYVHYKNKNGSQKYECGLACGNSWFFAQHIRELLNKLGIRAGIKSEIMQNNKTGERFHRVVFSGSENAERFSESIGSILGKNQPKASTTQRKPSQIKEELVNVDGEITHYAEIIAINEIGTNRVWDIHVPYKNWFIAGGIVAHNCGKTVHAAVDILHTAYFTKNAVILVMVTQKKLMNRMLEIMGNYLRQSDLKYAFKMGGGKKSKTNEVEPTYDYEMSVGDGFSKIRFFFVASNPDKIRGQRATHIYIDEADYYNDNAWPAITGIIKGNPDIRLVSTSTPCGIEGTWFYNFCRTCRDPNNKKGNEYHIKPTEDPAWPEIERQLRMVIFDEISWQLEVMAEFVEARGAVYKKELINAAVQRGHLNNIELKGSMIQNMIEYESADKFLGVDWNVPQNGVRLVEVADMLGGPLVCRNERISYETYTQTNSVKRILELYDKHRYKKIAVDHGYGEAQIELLTMELAKRGVDPKHVLIAVDAGKKDEVEIEYLDNLTNMPRKRKLEIKVKQRLVEVVAKYLEETLILLPEDDVEFDGLVKEIRNFQRKKGTRDNYLYSDNTHSLSALQHALYVYDLFHEERGPVALVDIYSTETLSDIIKSTQKQKTQNITLLNSGWGNTGGTSRRLGGLHGRTSRTII